MVEHYRARPINSRRPYRDDALMHYGVKGMRKGVRKERPTLENIPRERTYYSKIVGGLGPLKLKKDHNVRSQYVDGKKKTSYNYKYRLELNKKGKMFVSNTLNRVNNYSAAFKNQAKRMERNVRNFLAGSSGKRKSLTR